jgi:putative transposase
MFFFLELAQTFFSAVCLTNYRRLLPAIAMKRLQAFRFELRPNGEQQRLMRCFAGACRFVYNKALALQRSRFAAGEKYLSYAGLCAELMQWKAQPETSWLPETHSQVLQQSLKNLDCAYINFFAGRAGFPRFKQRGQHDSFRYPQGCKLEQHNDRIYLPRLGWCRYRNSRAVEGTVKNVTVSLSGTKWYVSVQTEREVSDPVPVGAPVGIDMGIVRFATMSDGSWVDPLNSFKKQQLRLARYQRRMARKQKSSRNWNKAKAKVAKLHGAIANARKDFLHKESTKICNSHAIVCMEDLKIGNMTRSAKGTLAQPGSKVKQKSGLNRAILDQGWGEFGRQIAYKVVWRGGHVVVVDPQYSSQTCPACSHVAAGNRRTQASFQCLACGFEGHADVVGASNILARGLRVIACGALAQSGHAVKQEPARDSQVLA